MLALRCWQDEHGRRCRNERCLYLVHCGLELFGLGRRVLLSVLGLYLKWLLQVSRLHYNVELGLFKLSRGLHEHGWRRVYIRL